MMQGRAVLLAGLVVLLTLPVVIGQSERYTPETTNRPLAPGAYRYYELDGREATKYDVLMQSTGAIDVLLLTEANFQVYKANTAGTFYIVDRFYAISDMRHIFELPSNGRYVLVFDNTDTPVGGAPGTTSVSVSEGYILLTPDGQQSGLEDFLRTLFLRQDYWQVPLITGVGIAGPTLLFGIAALVCAGYSKVNEQEQGHWWLAFLVLTAIGASFVVVVPGVGFVLDSRLLTIPAAAYGHFVYKRVANTGIAAAGVFSVAFFSSFVGVDLVTEIMHHGSHVEDYYYQGAIGVFGGAGWADLLILAPVIGVGTFLLWGRGQQTKLHVEATLAGDTRNGTIHFVVANHGERPAQNVRYSARFHGHGLPDTTIEDGLLIAELPKARQVSHAISSPGSKVEIPAQWESISVAVWAENAKGMAERISLNWR